MSYIEFHTTERDRTCKLCNCVMARGTWGLVMRDVHIPPKLRDIHFHEGCFVRALAAAQKEYPEKIRAHLAQKAGDA